MSTLQHREFGVLALAGCLLTGGLSACAHSPSAQQTSFARLTDAIESVDHPDAGWVAAMYVVLSDGKRAATLMHRSITALPGDPVVAFAALQACVAISSCDVAAATKHLREVDPDNGFSGLPELDAALSADDESRVDAALEEMSRRTEWRVYWNPAITRATAVQVLAARALPPADARELGNETWSLVAAIGVMGGILVPAYRPLTSACGVDRASVRHARCTQIARGLQRGDAIITQSVGYSIELKLTPPGSPEHEAASQRRQELRWLVRSQEPTTAPWADEFRQLQSSLDREEDVLREMLRRRGKAIQPPPGWNPGVG